VNVNRDFACAVPLATLKCFVYHQAYSMGRSAAEKFHRFIPPFSEESHLHLLLVIPFP